MSKVALKRAKKAVSIMKDAVVIRKQISALYSEYRNISTVVISSIDVTHADFKRAVDALYYLGGGWPKATSKGRMEALLDNFSGMYKILDLIGSGKLVEDYLKEKGISVSIYKEHKIKNVLLSHNDIQFIKSEFKTDIFSTEHFKDTKDLISIAVMQCEELQGQICALADKIKDELRPQAQDALEIEDAEYDRLFDIVKTSTKNTARADQSVIAKKGKIDKSVQSFNVGVLTL